MPHSSAEDDLVCITPCSRDVTNIISLWLMGVTKTKTLENEDLRPVLVFEITKTKTP